MKRKLKKLVTMAFAAVLLCTGFSANAEEEIKVSDKEYAVVLEKAVNAYLGNKTPVSGEVGTKVFLTYTVEKLHSNYATTNGVVATTKPHDKYPVSYGPLLWSSTQRDVGGILFQEGYTYVIRFERTEEGFAYKILKMKDDKVSNIQFTLGTNQNDAFPYFGIWTAGLGEDTVDAVLTHVRFYDAEGNDLGLDTNDISKVKIYENGEAGNYEDVKGGYYCEKNNTLLVLNEEKVAYVHNGKEGTEVDYKLMYGTQLILDYSEGKDIFYYTHMKVTDAEDNVYRRLQDAKVTFVTEEEIVVKPANVDNRYRVEKPADPKKEGNEFLGWYLGNGEEYKFDSNIFESITLYAKWRDGDGREYLAVNQEVEEQQKIDYTPYIAIGASAVVLIVLVTGYIIILKKRGKKNAKA